MRKLRLRPTELFKNKVVGLLLTIMAIVLVKINDGDATASLLIMGLAIALFTAKENCIM